MNRKAFENRRKTREIVARAVEKSRVRIPPTAIVSAGLEDNNHLNEQGETVRAFMLGVDQLGIANRFLVVRGKVINYGS